MPNPNDTPPDGEASQDDLLRWRDGVADAEDFRDPATHHFAFRAGDTGYDRGAAWVGYKEETGILLGAVATGKRHENPEVMQVFSAYNLKKVKYSATRDAEPPDIPSPRHSEPANTLVSANVVLGAPRPAEDGQTLTWSAEAEYVYFLKDHKGLGEYDLRTAQLPWTTVLSTESVIPKASFNQQITGTRSTIIGQGGGGAVP